MLVRYFNAGHMGGPMNKADRYGKHSRPPEWATVASRARKMADDRITGSKLETMSVMVSQSGATARPMFYAIAGQQVKR